MLLQHPPALFAEGEPARRSDASAPGSGAVSLFADPPAEVPADVAPPDPAAAPGPRMKAFAADAVLCAIVGASSFLSAAAAVRRAPTAGGWLWCAGFALLVSFFLVVPTLALFGRTPGMALADLTAEDAGGEKPSFASSLDDGLRPSEPRPRRPSVATFSSTSAGELADLFSGGPSTSTEPVA